MKNLHYNQVNREATTFWSLKFNDLWIISYLYNIVVHLEIINFLLKVFAFLVIHFITCLNLNLFWETSITTTIISILIIFMVIIINTVIITIITIAIITIVIITFDIITTVVIIDFIAIYPIMIMITIKIVILSFFSFHHLHFHLIIHMI